MGIRINTVKTIIVLGLFLVGIVFTSIPSAEALIADRQGTLVSERFNAWTLFGGTNRIDVVTDNSDTSGLYAQFNNQKDSFLVNLNMKGDPTLLDCKITSRMVRGDTFSGATKAFIIIEQSNKKISRGNDNFVTDSIQNFERVEVNNPITKSTWKLTDFSNTGFGVEQATDNKRSNLANFKVSCRVNDTVPPTITAPADIVQTATSPTGNVITNLGTPIVNDDIDPNPTVTIAGIPPGNVFPIGTTTLTYTVTDFAGNSATDTQLITIVDPHPTTVILRPIPDPYGGDIFTVTGELIDDVTLTGVPGKTVKFTGTGAGTLTDATTSGFTVADVNGIVIDTCCSPSDNILRLSEGATISIPSKPIFVSLSLKDMGTNSVDVEITNGVGGIFTSTGSGQGANIGLFTITDPSGISIITITQVSDDGRAGITRVETLNLEQTRIIDEGFASTTSSNPTSLSFAQGTFFTYGTAQLGTATDLVVDAYFIGDSDFKPSASTTVPPENVQTYSVFYNTAGGFGAASGETADTGLGVTSVLCGAGNDNDGDALCNDWETTGIPYAGGTYVLTGANPNKKDIYIEVDYMAGHNPFVSGSGNDAIDDVIAKFAAAPVANPSGSNGIVLHVDQGEQLSHTDTTAMWSGYNSLKSANFGTPSERGNAALITAKAQAYRYLIFAHGVGGASGVAEQRGNDAIIALGVGFTEVDATHAGTEGSRNQIAGTFMHEIGHLLNLNHGGPKYLITDTTQRTLADQAINCKPNHDSVMSYSRQLPNLLTGNQWILDFSDGGLGPAAGIRETTLVETAGNLIHAASPLPWIIWGTPGQAQTYLIKQSQSGGTPANIDWSGDGSISATAVSKDINNFGFFGCQASSGQTTFFKNYNEWANLDFNFRQGSSGQFDAAHATDDPQELDSEINTQLNILSTYHQDVSPWNAQSSTTINAGANVPIKAAVYDGQNIPIVSGGAIVTYKVFKAGSPNTPIATGTLSYDPGHWHADYTSLKQKGVYYIQIIVSDIGNVVHKITKDPDNNPQYQDGTVLMSMKFTLT